MLNNLAISSGPQVVVEVDLLAKGETVDSIFPWRIWQVDGNTNYQNRKGIDFFNIPSNANELMSISEYFNTQADDRTMIPRYSYGNQDVGGAGQTATGLNQLMNASNKGIKRLLRNVDMHVLRTMIRRVYRWNMVHSENPNVKGDCQVVAKGALSLFNKETAHQRITELKNSLSETDLRIIGIKGSAKLLREVFKSVGLSEEIVPSEEEILRMEQEDAAMAVMQAEAEAGAMQAEAGTP
jgi:hypothetical protein